jgi:hypothetical protein
MKLTPSSTARRKTFFAFSRLGGAPQIPSPVNRIAPEPEPIDQYIPAEQKRFPARARARRRDNFL